METVYTGGGHMKEAQLVELVQRAQTVGQDGRPTQDADAALARLCEQFRGVALRVIRGLKVWDRDLVNELVQEGSLGVVHAVRSYDPSKGASLLTWVFWKVRKMVQNAYLGMVREQASFRSDLMPAVPSSEDESSPPSLDPLREVIDEQDLRIATECAAVGIGTAAERLGLDYEQARSVYRAVRKAAREQFPLGVAS